MSATSDNRVCLPSEQSTTHLGHIRSPGPAHPFARVGEAWGLANAFALACFGERSLGAPLADTFSVPRMLTRRARFGELALP